MNPEPTTKRVGSPTGAVDRVSALPDGLLHAIMAFLPPPQVVRTSVLSQQWKDFHSFGDYGWEIGRKNITLHRQGGKTFQCQKLKLIEVIYDYDHDHQLIEFVWSLGRSLPDASIKLRIIDMVST